MQKAILALGGAYIGFKYLDSKLQLSHDLGFLKKLSSVRKRLEHYSAGEHTVADWWEDSVAKYGDKAAFGYQGQYWSFKQMDAVANQIANWGLSIGLKKGQVVSILMENCVEYVLLYLGLAKIGVVTAFINSNLRNKGLMHCVSVSGSVAMVFNPALHDAILEINQDLNNNNIKLFFYGEGDANIGMALKDALASQSTKAPSKEVRKGLNFFDNFAYIYTSGTTGLPKASKISHQRMFLYGCSFYFGYELVPDDIIYGVLPLYHSSACLGVGAMIEGGVTYVTRKKFSVSSFWKEATETKATVIQYIGELCRYLLNHPPGPYDQGHKVRVAVGNGLRPEIWLAFQQRFNIKYIGEFYGSTEGNGSLMNFASTKQDAGFVGRHGYLLKKATGVKIVKFDVEREEVIRGKDGFCIECAPGEAGEFITPIIPGNNLARFDGYTDAAATKKKILSDCFVKGDNYVRTGDLLSRNSQGYYSFIDRIGDTFRWKGENVSTTEVAQVLSIFPGVTEANVYGVQIPGKDGRACMAGIICKDDIDFNGLLKHCNEQLPAYAVPMFLRKLKEIDITGTFKHQKVELRKEGIDLKLVQDPIYWLNPSSKKYEPFTSDALNLIASGKAKL